MTRDREGDTNRKYRVIPRMDAWISPEGYINMRNPGKYVSPRWYYRDNPIDGIGEKEFTVHFEYLENRSINSEFDE